MTNLSWTVMMCCRKVSCAMSFRKSAQRHGKMLQDKGLQSPSCCLADNWRMNGLTSCFHKGTCGPPSLSRGLPQSRSRSELFAKNGADCRSSICEWTSRLPGIYYTIVCTHYKDQRAPEVLDINGFIRAFRGKDENAHAVIDTYMDYCAKRWQIREGTYQLKRRRLLPDVRDLPEQGDEEVDMKDI